MIVRRVGWATFQLPFRHPFVTAHATLDLRRGIVVRLVNERGAIGLGEASAVRGFGGSQIEVEAAIARLAPGLLGRDPTDPGDLGAELDSGIGVAAAIQLAATLPSPLLPCGLATSSLLPADLIAAPLPIEAGAMRVPDRPGLAATLDEAAIGELLGPWQEAAR